MTQREPIAIDATGGRAIRLSFAPVETLAAHRTLTLTEIETYNGFSFDPGGAARNLIMPAEAHCKGVFLFISNAADAAEIITVQNDAPATICTPTQGEDAVIWCDGTSWFGGVVTAS